MGMDTILGKDRKYETLIEATHTAYVVLDPEGYVLDANAEYVRLTGSDTLTDILGHKVAEWTAPHDLERNVEEVKKCMVQGSVRNLEIDYIDKNGRMTPIEINATTMITHEGLRIITLCRDITERKRAEQCLRENERQRDTFFSLIPDLIFRLDAEGYFITYKAQSDHLLFAPPHQFIGKHFKDVLPSHVATPFAELLKRASSTSEIQKLIYSLALPPGHGEVFEARICPQINGEFIVLCRNITEQHKAEDALKASEELARQRLAEIEAYYHTAPIGLCVVDNNMRYLRINERLAMMNGHLPMEHIGKTVREMIPFLADTAEALIRQAIASGNPVMNVELQNMADSLPGVRQVGLIHLYPLKDSAGKVASVNIVVEDITERKALENALRESEAHYRLLAENSNDVVFTVDLLQRPTYISPSITRLIGYSVEEAMGLTIREVYAPESFSRVISIYQEEMEKEKAGDADPARLRIADLDMMAKDGSLVPVEVSFSFLRNKEKETQGFMAIMRSIAGRRKVEEQLRRANEELEKRVDERTARLRKVAAASTLIEQKERRRLADMLHDDLQQLLVGAKLQLEVLSEIPGADGKKQIVERVKTIMDEAIGKSRSLCAELGTPLLHGASLEPSLHWLCHHMEELHGLEVSLELKGPLKPKSEDVKILIFHALRELLFNVIKHSGCQSASVALEQKGSHTEIVVADAGRGFDLSAEREMDVYGGGYGLFSIRERMINIGGRMIVESKSGHGTRVTLIIPDESNPSL